MNSKSLRKAVMGVGFCAAALFAGAAMGGEVNGKGESLKNPDGTLNGKSACAFSGLNDTYSGDPSTPDADGFFRTQNWGQIPLAIRLVIMAMGGSPGNSCNPTKAAGEPQ
jgi:hypothetical protein